MIAMSDLPISPDGSQAVPQVASYAGYLRACTHAAPKVSVTGGRAQVSVSRSGRTLVLAFQVRTRRWGDNCTADIPTTLLDDKEPGVTDEWPLRSFLELPATTAAPRRARDHARRVMRDWGLADLEQTCALALSELMTNSVEATGRLGLPATVRCWLYSDKQKVFLLVWDASPEPPAPVPVDLDSLTTDGEDNAPENGRGLFLVSQMSEQWNWSMLAGGGKVVWALISEAVL
jgi:anti-sigma regulatory factor (Ser/Thr protein kinase)